MLTIMVDKRRGDTFEEAAPEELKREKLNKIK